MKWTSAWNWLRRQPLHRQLLGLILLSLLPVTAEWLLRSSAEPPPPPTDPLSVDTLIPAGSVLVPIEVENSESLDSILGSKGVVDLHRPAREPGAHNRLVARRVPILRAPLNPHQFAVLVSENQAPAITKEPGAFWVTVQNPKKFGTEFEVSKPPRPAKRCCRRVILDGGVE